MPPFINNVQPYEAVESQPVPYLQAIATNGNLFSPHRFESDDPPPPYVSSIEFMDRSPFPPLPRPPRPPRPPPVHPPLPQSMQAIMEPPLDDEEIGLISRAWYKLVDPADRYQHEATHEGDRLDRWTGPLPEVFRGTDGPRREGVIIRHNVKRRWTKLGIWNPAWGFAGRNVQPGDDYKRWTWPWQPDGASDDRDRANQAKIDIIARALRLRRNLRRGEPAPVIPRACPTQDTTAAQAEAFLVSRPWLVFRIELLEENIRYSRLSEEDRRSYPHLPVKQVIEWWKERGDWRDASIPTFHNAGWKWRYESPSPEPEDLRPVRQMRWSPFETAADMEFTPSEVDDLETIDLPEYQWPEGFWTIAEHQRPPFFPGQLADVAASEKKRRDREMALEERCKISAGSRLSREGMGILGDRPSHMSSSPPLVEHEVAASAEHQEGEPEPQPDAHSPAQQPRRRLREHQQEGGQDQEHLVPPPRRSARIAAMKRPAEPLPSQTAPNKRPRRITVPKTARVLDSVETRQVTPPVPLPEAADTRPGQARRRPKKVNKPSRRSAAKETPARTPATARTRSGRVRRGPDNS